MCETSDREYITANKIREFDRKRGKIGNGERDRCRRPEFAEKSISYLVFFFLDSASPRFQFDCFILTFPLVQFSRDSYLLSSFPHALIKIRLLATSRIILYRRNESQRRIYYSRPVRRIHFEAHLITLTQVCICLSRALIAFDERPCRRNTA